MMHHVFSSESMSASNESDDIDELFRYLVLVALSIGDDNTAIDAISIALLSAAV
jgi:hypothetical protein